MINLNSNYDDIRRQLKQIENSVYSCANRNTAVAYIQIYDILNLFYYISTGEKIGNSKIKNNKAIIEIAKHKVNEIKNKYTKNFLSNKDFHFNLLFSFYLEALEVIDEFYDGDYYQELLATYNKPLNAKTNEDLDLLLNFFAEEDPKMKELFIDMMKSGRIYKLNPLLKKTGLTVFNSIENICNVFVRERIPSIEYLTTYVHEMGHVVDHFDCGYRFSSNDQKMYSSSSLYPEVLSTLYQQKFYEFLLGNGIRKEETILNAMDYFYNYIEEVGDAILFSALPDENHQMAVLGNFTRDELVSIIEGSDMPDDSEDLYVPSFDDSIEYSYGLMIANSIIHDNKKFDEFLNIRKGLFDASKLKSIGIVPEEIGKKIIKNIRMFADR